MNKVTVQGEPLTRLYDLSPGDMFRFLESPQVCMKMSDNSIYWLNTGTRDAMKGSAAIAVRHVKSVTIEKKEGLL